MASARCSIEKVYKMGFTSPETQASEGPDGNTVETKVPGTSFGDRLTDYARQQMPTAFGMSDGMGATKAPDSSSLIEMNAKPKEGGGLAAIIKLLTGGGG